MKYDTKKHFFNVILKLYYYKNVNKFNVFFKIKIKLRQVSIYFVHINLNV